MKHDLTADGVTEGVRALRALIMAGEHMRHAIAAHYAIGTTETAALSNLRVVGALGPRELADRLGLTPSTVTSVVDRLETVGFVERSAHPTDRRMTVVSLTTLGDEVVVQFDEWLSSAIDRLGRDAIPGVTAALLRLATGLEEQTSEINALPRRVGPAESSGVRQN